MISVLISLQLTARSSLRSRAASVAWVPPRDRNAPFPWTLLHLLRWWPESPFEAGNLTIGGLQVTICAFRLDSETTLASGQPGTHLALSPDGTRLAAGVLDADGQVRLATRRLRSRSGKT